MESNITETMKRNIAGQSEVIGVVILLGLTITAISGIFVFGGPSITEGTEVVDSGSMENEFALLDSKMATAALGASEVQNVELNLRDGSLDSVPDGATMRLFHNFTREDVLQLNSTVENIEDVQNVDSSRHVGCVDGSWDCDLNIDSDLDDIAETLNTTLFEIDMGKVEYTKDNEKLAYEGGGVWRGVRDSSGSSMVSPPEFHYSLRGQTLTIPLFNVTSNLSVTADRGDVKVGTTTEPRQLFDENPIVGGAVKAEVESDYYRAWANYFDTRTQGDVGDENIDDENNTATVELVVPADDDIDGGHAFQGSADSGWFETDPGENEFFLSASEMIEERLSQARDSNDNNRHACIDETGFNGCGTIDTPDDEDAVYYFDDEPNMEEVDFDISEGNITIAVDGAFRANEDWSITDNNTGETRMEILLREESQGGQPFMPGQVNLNAPPNSGNTSEMVYFVHSDVGELDIAGAGNSQKYVTLYAPETTISPSGFGNAEWEGAIIGGDLDASGNEPQNPIRQGSGVDGILDGDEDTVTFLQVTENEVTVE